MQISNKLGSKQMTELTLRTCTCLYLINDQQHGDLVAMQVGLNRIVIMITIKRMLEINKGKP